MDLAVQLVIVTKEKSNPIVYKSLTGHWKVKLPQTESFWWYAVCKLFFPYCIWWIINIIVTIRLKTFASIHVYVLRHYVFLEAQRFCCIRFAHTQNCSLHRTDRTQGQISEHIFGPNWGYCLSYIIQYPLTCLAFKSLHWRARYSSSSTTDLLSVSNHTKKLCQKSN